jgi:regulator of replication initiation timing
MILDFEKAAPKPQTLEECHALIEVLWEFCRNLERQLKAELSTIKEEMLLLRQENAALKERLNINSQNSSLPPSKDFKK